VSNRSERSPPILVKENEIYLPSRTIWTNKTLRSTARRAPVTAKLIGIEPRSVPKICFGLVASRKSYPPRPAEGCGEIPGAAELGARIGISRCQISFDRVLVLAQCLISKRKW
jgi:hypothetical protein